ncbi:MAG TPA: hypothetical protein VGJ07_32945 [Rugosimonospora sp.]
MSPLEHRYRRLLRLLPPEHRAARGEEFLGLLLDLDDGRTRPSARQALGLIGLAIRLRLTWLPATGSVLFSAFLVAYGTMGIGNLIDDYTGGYLSNDMPMVRHVTPGLLVPGLVQLGTAVAWILGARRIALAVEIGGLAYFIVEPMAADLVMLFFDLALICLLGVAVRRHWTTPRPRSLWLAAVVLAVLAWKGIGAWGRHGIYYPVLPPRVGWILAAVAAAIAVGLARRRRPPVIVVAALIGVAAGRILPPVALQLAYGQYGGWLTTITVGTAILVSGGMLLTGRLPDRPDRPVLSGSAGDGTGA